MFVVVGRLFQFGCLRPYFDGLGDLYMSVPGGLLSYNPFMGFSLNEDIVTGWQNCWENTSTTEINRWRLALSFRIRLFPVFPSVTVCLLEWWCVATWLMTAGCQWQDLSHNSWWTFSGCVSGVRLMWCVQPLPHHLSVGFPAGSVLLQDPCCMLPAHC